MVDVVGVMESIAVDPDQDERIRDSAILFSVSSAQSHSISSALAVLSRIRTSIVDDQHSWLIDSLEDDLRVYGYVALY
jgi:type IV secretory pathway VirB4 component